MLVWSACRFYTLRFILHTVFMLSFLVIHQINPQGFGYDNKFI